MSIKLKFNYKSFVICITLFLLLVFIAVNISNSFIRGFLGDTLAVIWLYYLVDSFFKTSQIKLLVGVLIFSYTIEFLQYLKVLKLLSLDHIKVLNVVLGSTFDIKDLLAYTLGALVIYILVKKDFINK